MSGATIITLGPSNDSTMNLGYEAASFDEAFGDFSEAKGKGRARRKARKLERVENKREVKGAKTAAKREKRIDKVEAKRDKRVAKVESKGAVRSSRQEGRQGRKTERGERRLSRRDDRMTSRQGTRTKRKTLKQERSEIGEEEEPLDETVDTDETEDTGSGSETGVDTINPIDSESSDQGYEEEGDYEGEGDYEEEGDYEGEGDYEEEGGYEEDGYGDYEGGYEEESTGPQYSDEENGNFDGVLNDSFLEMDDNAKTTRIKVSPSLLELTNKIEWNKELISRLENRRKMGVQNPSEVSKQIIDRKRRLAALEGNLEMYLGFGAEFSSADGMLVPTKRKGRPTKTQIQRRSSQVAVAKRKAKRERQRGMQDKMSTRKKASHGGDSTPVDTELQPQFKRDKIMVPPTGSSFDAFDYADGQGDAFDYANGQGDAFDYANGQGDAFDYANGSDTAFDYADGTKSSKINWAGVFVGVGVGVLAILAIKKYKLLSK